MQIRFVTVILALALAACGARSDLASNDAPHRGGGLKLVVVPIDDLFETSEALGTVKIVARSQGFDLLANDRSSILARRATVAAGPLALDFAGPPSPIIGDALNGFEAAASGDLLAVCYNQSGVDPILFSSFTGTYAPRSSATLFARGSSCDGIALRGDQGLVAVEKQPDDRMCCLRPGLTPISAEGSLTGPEVLALPEGEPADVRLARYSNGYVSAGFVQAPALFVRLAPDGGAVSSTQFPITTVAEPLPHLAAWPFDANQAAVAFLEGPDKPHVVVIGETGKTTHTVALSRSDAKRITLPALTSVTSGLLCAYMEWPSDMGNGSTVIELHGADGFVIAGPEELPGAFAAGVMAAAAYDDVALFAWPKPDGGYQGALVEVVR